MTSTNVLGEYLRARRFVAGDRRAGALAAFVSLLGALASFACAKNPGLPEVARDPDIEELASRPCAPIPQGMPYEPSVRVTFTNSAPIWPVDIHLLSIEGRCAHLVPVMPDGTRALGNLPRGDYILRATGPGSSMIQPIRFSLPFEVAVSFNLPVIMENRVQLCGLIPACQEVLTHLTSGERTETQDKRILILGHRLGIAMAIEVDPKADGWVACVSGDDELMSQLRQVYSRVAPRSECIREPDGNLSHAPSRRPARLIESSIALWADTGVNLRVSFTGPGAGARSHACYLHRTELTFVPYYCYGSDQSSFTRPTVGPPGPPPPPNR